MSFARIAFAMVVVAVVALVAFVVSRRGVGVPAPQCRADSDCGASAERCVLHGCIDPGSPRSGVCRVDADCAPPRRCVKVGGALACVDAEYPRLAAAAAEAVTAHCALLRRAVVAAAAPGADWTGLMAPASMPRTGDAYLKAMPLAYAAAARAWYALNINGCDAAMAASWYRREPSAPPPRCGFAQIVSAMPTGDDSAGLMFAADPVAEAGLPAVPDELIAAATAAATAAAAFAAELKTIIASAPTVAAGGDAAKIMCRVGANPLCAGKFAPSVADLAASADTAAAAAATLGEVAAGARGSAVAARGAVAALRAHFALS